MRISDWSSDVCSSDLDAPELILIELRGEVAELAQDIQQLREALPGAPVVVLTDERDPGTLAACLHAGAAAFLLKDISLEALIHSLKLAMLGQKVMPTELARSEEHTSELQSLMRISYAVFCLKKKTRWTKRTT